MLIKKLVVLARAKFASWKTADLVENEISDWNVLNTMASLAYAETGRSGFV